MTLLELDNVTKRFGAISAVDDVSFQLEREGITALIGPNGAGKTTMYNLISGKMEPTKGRILFNGEDVTDDQPGTRTRKGLGRSFQITNVFDGLTVYENIRTPIIARSTDRRNFVHDVDSKPALAEETEQIIDLVGLEDVSSMPCQSLSYGDRRRVEIGITLATDPDLVLLDEPTAGMNPTETKGMVKLIDHLDEQTDKSFMVTEHDMKVVFAIASRIMVLNRGQVIEDGTPGEIQQSEEVKSAYLGREEHDTPRSNRSSTPESGSPTSGRADGKAVLEVEGIHTYYGASHALNGVSLQVNEAETVALLGRNGAGKTTTLRSIIGQNPPRRGEIHFRGERIDGDAPFEISRRGIGFVPEGRDVFGDLTVTDNLEIVIDDESEWTKERVYDLFPNLEERSNSKARQLSGGEQQMLAIARSLVTDPDLLLLDEPSEGLAPVIVDNLGDLLVELMDTGITVLLTEQNIGFALALADRGYILDKGTIVWEGTIEDLQRNEDVVDRYLSLAAVGKE